MKVGGLCNILHRVASFIMYMSFTSSLIIILTFWSLDIISAIFIEAAPKESLCAAGVFLYKFLSHWKSALPGILYKQIIMQHQDYNLFAHKKCFIYFPLLVLAAKLTKLLALPLPLLRIFFWTGSKLIASPLQLNESSYFLNYHLAFCTQ